MQTFQEVRLLGYLGGDPDVRTTQSGVTVAAFSVATTKKWKDKQTKEAKESTTWHKVVVWGSLASVCGEYLRKGSPVFITGELYTESWDSNGTTMYATKIRADQVIFLGGGNGGNSGSPGEDSYSGGCDPRVKGANDLPF